MKLKDLVAVIPEHHRVSVFDYDYEGDCFLDAGYKKDISKQYLSCTVKEVQGVTMFETPEDLENEDGTDIVMIWITLDDELSLNQKNSNLRAIILEHADDYNDDILVSDLPISNRCKMVLIRHNIKTVGDILQRLKLNRAPTVRHPIGALKHTPMLGVKLYNEILTYLVENAYDLYMFE